MASATRRSGISHFVCLGLKPRFWIILMISIIDDLEGSP